MYKSLNISQELLFFCVQNIKYNIYSHNLKSEQIAEEKKPLFYMQLTLSQTLSS